jgi:hypothetical protein
MFPSNRSNSSFFLLPVPVRIHSMIGLCRGVRLFGLALPLAWLVPWVSLFAQEPPADAAEISRDLLFLAPTAIERKQTPGSLAVALQARRFAYLRPIVGEATLPTLAGGEWQIEPTANGPAPAGLERRKKLSFSLGEEEYVLTAASDDDRATVALRRGGASEPLAEAVVWTRADLVPIWLALMQKQRKGLTAAVLRKDLEVADPVLDDVEGTGGSVWVALGHSKGEMELGIGTLVRFDLKEKQAQVFHPNELSTCEVAQLGLGPTDTLFLGTRTQLEGAISPCAGLVAFHPSSGQIEKITVGGTRLSDSVVTALLGTQSGGWVATDWGICTFAPDGAGNCWRIVPTVSLKAATPVVNRPGEQAASQLPPGDYEVLWANAGFFEVATKDSLDAWLAADDFAEATARHFDTEPYKLLNTADPPDQIRLLVKPGGDPLGAAIVYRAPLEKRPTEQSSTPAGWVFVRAHIGWVPRGDLEVVPRLISVAAKP